LYGFGRIGRLLERLSKTGKSQLRLRAIVTRDKNDAVSLEKELPCCVTILFMVIWRVTADPENNALIINGTTVHIITAGPEEIDYTLFDIHNLGD
jgi:glyceraldehyde 3-phosphate dehydrogenase